MPAVHRRAASPAEDRRTGGANVGAAAGLRLLDIVVSGVRKESASPELNKVDIILFT